MVKISAAYSGELHCELIHGPSQSRIETDAPKDNQGRGERFSPTDLVGAALASCILTTMAILAERDGVSMKGAQAEVEKHMNPQPRRILRFPIVITLPASIPAEYRPKLEHIANACPVSRSLHPDVSIEATFRYV